MPVFTIQDTVTGRTLKVRGDSAPTEQEAEELFASQSKGGEKFTPELVAGNESQMAEQRARNLQGSLGLSEPVSPTGRVPIKDRVLSGFAPTAEERKAYYETEYGQGSFIPVSSNRALVKVDDGKGGKQWVIDNPVGLDAGDVAELSSNVPQMIAGATAALKAVPGPSGALGRVAAASGASALAAGVVGALQDATYRSLTGTEINPTEIVQRRGLGAAMETVAGIALPVVGSGILQKLEAGRATKQFLNQFKTAANESKESLKAYGVDVRTHGEVADAVRALHPADANAAQLGDALASVVNQQDEAIRKGAARMSGMALSDAEKRANAIIGASSVSAPVAPEAAGMAAIGAAKQRIADGEKMVNGMYDAAYQEIEAGAGTSGVGKFFVKLSETKKTVDELMGNVMRMQKATPAEQPGATGGLLDAFGRPIPASAQPPTPAYKPSEAFAPLLTQLRQIEQATTATQKLDAARQARTMIGERIRGKGGIFGDLNDSSAKEIYKALSNDIDRSISEFSGSGAAALQKANAAYKNLVGVVDESPFIDKLVNNGFTNPEDVVRALASGGTKDWAAAKSVLPANTYAAVRRGVLGELTGEGQGNKLVQFGREVLDVPTLNKRLSGMDVAVKNEIFGGEAPWRALEKIGREYDFVVSRGGVFTKPALPSIADIKGAADIARLEGFDAANKYVGKAIAAANARRNGLAESYLSQARNGNVEHIVRDPESFLRSVIFNSEVRPENIRAAVNKLPADTRGKLGNVAFQEIFENARQVGDSMVAKSGSYNVDTVVNQVFGDRKRMEVLSDILGPQRMGVLKDWTRFELASAVQAKKGTMDGKRVAGLVATAPYQNLFAARATAMALEKASGAHLVGTLTHDKAKLFQETRRIMNNPSKSAVEISLLQRAMNTNGFSDYVDMLDGFSPEQRDAIDSYLTRGN